MNTVDYREVQRLNNELRTQRHNQKVTLDVLGNKLEAFDRVVKLLDTNIDLIRRALFATRQQVRKERDEITADDNEAA